MPANVKVSNSWKTVAAMHTRVGGSWKNVTEGYTKIGGAWKQFFASTIPLTVEYLVIAGGGGGGQGHGGGGGAGGYRTASGVSLTAGSSYTVTVGAGGNGSSNDSARGSSGSNSVFSTITSAGGGGGGSRFDGVGGSGGSGGGGSYTANGGAGNTPSVSPSQGNNGGGPGFAGGGGGGASAVGGTSASGGTAAGAAGGAGAISSITGTAVTRAGGGGGGGYCMAGGAGGAGGGGAGGSSAGSPGTVNTGGGGGGGAFDCSAQRPGASGGSGIVIIKYPDTFAINPSPGLSHRTVTSGGFNITTFTAGTGTVSFSEAVDSDYELIETVYLTTSQTSVTFDVSGLGSTYQHLQIRAMTRNTSTAGGGATYGANGIIRFNGVSSSSYRTHYLQGDGSSAISGDYGSVTGVYVQDLGGSWDSNTANIYAASVVDILDPFETTKNTSTKSLSGVARVQLDSGAWFNTAAVTSITITQDGTAFKANSRISLYGLKGS